MQIRRPALAAAAVSLALLAPLALPAALYPF